MKQFLWKDIKSVQIINNYNSKKTNSLVIKKYDLQSITLSIYFLELEGAELKKIFENYLDANQVILTQC